MAAWLGLIVAGAVGATTLFLSPRRFGRRLVESQFAEYVHLTPERVAKAEQWFKRYGVLAIIFGRHIPGFRIPITVASGIFEVRCPVFAASVAVSTAIWAGVVLIIGINFGPRLADLLRAHSILYFVWGGLVVALVLSIFIRQQLRARAARMVKTERRLEKPGPSKPLRVPILRGGCASIPPKPPPTGGPRGPRNNSIRSLFAVRPVDGGLCAGSALS